jgi:glycosyltransferase involved in cell wall biosynthesis
MKEPLVSVICVSYNHTRFVEEAIRSVVNQAYKNIEIIIVDDASNDSSQEVIRKLVVEFPSIQFLLIEKNVGNCKAFNLGFALSKGDFIIDFATDDVMMPDRIAKQIALFQFLPPNVGVVFTDATYINEEGKFLRKHYEYLFRKRLLNEVPQGDVYTKVLSRYFIPSPTMMVKRVVLEKIGGYDETLAYEDFDFWVRSARSFKYSYLNESLTKIRKSTSSMSTGWYKSGDKQLHSTYLVCKKAQKLNKNTEEVDALITRVRYEIRQSVFSKNVNEAKLFFELLCELTKPNLIDRTLIGIHRLPIPFQWIRNLYHTIRFS